jgi:mRNA interferase MazF
VVRAIHLAEVGTRTRPVLVLTREHARDMLVNVTVAPITSTVRGIPTEVPVGPLNGLDRECVISCDNIVTIAKVALGPSLRVLGAPRTARPRPYHS